MYPASFFDSNGDGIGDIPGIASKLPYLKELGVDIIWVNFWLECRSSLNFSKVSPMFDSPQVASFNEVSSVSNWRQVDMGYDISDYEAVYPPYGTLRDMDELISKTHSLGMRIILDLVINHTSHLHKWFLESRSSKTNPKRDWYVNSTWQ